MSLLRSPQVAVERNKESYRRKPDLKDYKIKAHITGFFYPYQSAPPARRNIISARKPKPASTNLGCGLPSNFILELLHLLDEVFNLREQIGVNPSNDDGLGLLPVWPEHRRAVINSVEV